MNHLNVHSASVLELEFLEHEAEARVVARRSRARIARGAGAPRAVYIYDWFGLSETATATLTQRANELNKTYNNLT